MKVFPNPMKFAVILVAFTALQWLAAINARLFATIPSEALWTGVALVYALVGAIAYSWFHGRVVVRLLLVVALPAISNLILMLVLDNPGYSGLMVLLIVPYAIVFGVGAGIAAWAGMHAKQPPAR